MYRRLLLTSVLVLGLAAAVSSLPAAVSVFVSESDITYKGSWFWNSSTAAAVKVRAAYFNSEPDDVNEIVRIVVKARAVDGTTVQGQAVGAIPRLQTREFTILLPKPVTSLLLIQILDVPNGVD